MVVWSLAMDDRAGGLAVAARHTPPGAFPSFRRHCNGSNDMSARTTTVVFMGVCGSGKTTIAKLFAQRIGWPFAEADDFHSAANVAKMASGTPLTDDDRWPWLRSLRDWISKEATAGHNVVMTCSALKKAYRDILREANSDVYFIELTGSREVLMARLTSRKDHYMPAKLLDSQLAILESIDDEPGFIVDIDHTASEVVDNAIALLKLPVVSE